MINNEENTNKNLAILLVSCLILLIGIGMSFFYSASFPASIKYFNNQYYYLFRQSIFLIIGIALFIFAAKVKIELYERNIKFIVIVTVILLIITLVPFIGKEVGGGRRWINLGFTRFQPSDISKIVVIMYLSFVLANKKDFIKDFYKGIFPPLSMVVFIAFLVLAENDFSTACIILLVAIVIFYLSGIQIATFIMLIITGGVSAVMLIFVAQYRVKRLFSFLNPWEDPLGAGWQYIQSMKCFAIGKFFGEGLGESVQKLSSLPEPHNDYIFAVIGEEGGALFSIIIIILYTVFAFIGFNIAKRCKNKNYFLIAAGISALIFIQAMVNIGVVTGVLPSTGITLPFISSGGSSLVSFMFAVGLLFNISLENRKDF